MNSDAPEISMSMICKATNDNALFFVFSEGEIEIERERDKKSYLKNLMKSCKFDLIAFILRMTLKEIIVSFI